MAKKRRRIILIGGLGNVLYQLNAVEQSENFDIDVGLLSRKFIHRVLGWTYHNTVDVLNLEKQNIVKSGLLRILMDLFCLAVVRKLGWKQPRYSWESISSSVCSGYFQDPLWINKGVNKEFIQSFLMKHEESSYKQRSVMHYRLGDSVWRSDYQYYYDYMKSLIIHDDFLVLTDSPRELQLELPHDKIDIRRGPLLEDFHIMISSNHLVVSPSTLSWWAAMLKTEGVVTMPKEIYNKLGFNNKNVRLECI